MYNRAYCCYFCRSLPSPCHSDPWHFTFLFIVPFLCLLSRFHLFFHLHLLRPNPTVGACTRKAASWRSITLSLLATACARSPVSKSKCGKRKWSVSGVRGNDQHKRPNNKSLPTKYFQLRLGQAELIGDRKAQRSPISWGWKKANIFVFLKGEIKCKQIFVMKRKQAYVFEVRSSGHWKMEFWVINNSSGIFKADVGMR